MKTRIARTVLIAAVLLTAASLGASAQTLVGWEKGLSGSAQAYVQTRGVDLKYVTMAQDQVPADQWSTITALTGDAKFLSIVQTSLQSIVTNPGETAYVMFGGKALTVTGYRNGSENHVCYTFSVK